MNQHFFSFSLIIIIESVFSCCFVPSCGVLWIVCTFSLLVPNKMKKNLFEVKHFTYPVQYTLDYFIAKNKDTLSNDILVAMKTSKDPIVLSLFQDLVGDDDTTKGRKVTDFI